jgi:hypothetical protein
MRRGSAAADSEPSLDGHRFTISIPSGRPGAGVEDEPVVTADLIHERGRPAVADEQAVRVAADAGDGQVGHKSTPFGRVRDASGQGACPSWSSVS